MFHRMSEKEESVANREGYEGKREAFQTDCFETLQLKNGMQLKLSSLDAYFLNRWVCQKKKHRTCYCKKLRSYGKVELSSSFYMKPKSHSIIF